MQIDILTLFPKMFESPFAEGIIKRAIDKEKLSIDFLNFRKYSEDNYGSVDDYPYGGAAGMILKPEPIFKAVDELREKRKEYFNSDQFPLYYLTPQGEKFDQEMAKELSKKDYFALLAGRYKDVDYRVREHLVRREISIGDYVLSGGELPAMVIVDAIARLQKGVLSDFESAETDSFHNQQIDCPYYTRPREYRGYEVPEVLLSGNHKKIADWQEKKRKELTKKFRNINLNE
ncbi:MAG: tRNA (guanosine(37)-N1)-methyltransferase TrmD [Candidatus Cloacimonetes bacterium]|nr:tRNA (guanosine(37)-N1)-methyltransferase TrmD [Candidatus Cloacimonadota bacterium]MBS3767929.1 tRNA (guanosine(37)-N1)-methyltransferase TrmD [Candidatus Cloacimonadota bacterium]